MDGEVKEKEKNERKRTVRGSYAFMSGSQTPTHMLFLVI
jgi:hypothetical protein